MLRTMIFNLALVSGLALAGCSTVGAGARASSPLSSDDVDGVGGVGVVAAHRLDLENAQPTGAWAPLMQGAQASDSQDPIPILPAPDALQSGSGSGHFRVGGRNPVARIE